MSLFDKSRAFHAQVAELRSRNRFFYLRQLDPPAAPVARLHGRRMLNLGSNNYLGLTTHPKVVEAAIQAIRDYGTGACSSRILAGTGALHNRLERRLAEFKGTEDAIVFTTGFMTMMGTVAAIAGEGDIIFSDELNHASIVEGCRLSRAAKRIYRHNDMADLEEQLAGCDVEANKLIVTDGVFSMRGAVANLPGIKRLADRYNAKTMVDDAHGTGVLGATGRGTPEHYHMEGQIDLICGTFSKSLATVGGFTGAKAEVVEFLRLNSRPFVFTASPPPSVVATVLACLDVIEGEPDLLRKLHDNATFLKKGLKDLGFSLEDTITPIIPVRIGDAEKTFRMAGELQGRGGDRESDRPPCRLERGYADAHQRDGHVLHGGAGRGPRQVPDRWQAPRHDLAEADGHEDVSRDRELLLVQ
ncbi:MAG: aminotransferase class I/II-fold pyridoxal phosphate-dependent enzyme [Planctomycetes bacterium]|nr:aminotransferase class I/II-fold pyridoxal phosphate-dependent enzyme [Planctomycetota bacterium]